MDKALFLLDWVVSRVLVLAVTTPVQSKPMTLCSAGEVLRLFLLILAASRVLPLISVTPAQSRQMKVCSAGEINTHRMIMDKLVSPVDLVALRVLLLVITIPVQSKLMIVYRAGGLIVRDKVPSLPSFSNPI